VAIKDEPNAAYQLRRYAWSAKLPLSLLTDFGELAVYDCRVKPEKTRRERHRPHQLPDFEQYPDRWAEIAGVFSKDAVLKGSFDGFRRCGQGQARDRRRLTPSSSGDRALVGRAGAQYRPFATSSLGAAS